MKSHARRLLAAVVSLTAVGLVISGPSTVQAAELASADGKLIGTLDPSTLSAKPKQVVTRENGATTGGSCTPTVEGSKERSEGIVSLCLETAPPAPNARASTTGDTQAAAAACTPGYWNHMRLGSCGVRRSNLTAYDSNGNIVGTGLIQTTSSATLSGKSDSWTEAESTTLVSATGKVTSVNVAMTVKCDNGCTTNSANPWIGARTLGVGQSATGNITYKSPSMAAGENKSVQLSYQLYVTVSGGVPTDPNDGWINPLKVRCDAEVLATIGCVYSGVRANLVLPLSEYGEAAALYGWAQRDLIDHWGSTANPLTRIDSEATADANRARTCGSQSTVPFIPFDDAVVLGDSCDEYPFAGTLQGGTNGALCAEVVPKLENGQWNFYLADNSRPVNYNEPCVRGHVPSRLNSSAGGKYGNFAQNDRVLDLEQFNVTITL